MLWFKRLLRIKGHFLLWSSIVLVSLWLMLIATLHLIALKPDLLYQLAELADANLTISKFDSQTHPLATSVTLSLEGIDLNWETGFVHIDNLIGDIDLWSLLTPDLAIGREMRIQGMKLTLIAQNKQDVSEQPLSSPWLRFWNDTQINDSEVIWQAEAPWQLSDIQLSLLKQDKWQANLTAQWHYPGFSAMPLTAVAYIDHQFGFNPKASFSAELAPNNLPILGQNYHAKLTLTGNWDAKAIKARISLQAEENTSTITDTQQITSSGSAHLIGSNQIIGELRSEDLVNWELLVQSLEMNGENIALPVWPRITVNPQQGAKLALHQVRLTAQDHWVAMLPNDLNALWQTWQPELWLKQLFLSWTPDGRLSSIRGGIDILRWQAQDIAPGVDLRELTFNYEPQDGRLEIIPTGGTQLSWAWANTPPVHISTSPFVLILDPEAPFRHWELPLWQVTLGKVTAQIQITIDEETSLSAHLSAPDVSDVMQLLPMHYFSSDLQHWLAHAFVQGEKPTVNLNYHGDITDLLAGKWTEKTLQMTANIQQTTLAFDPKYPPLSHANIELTLKEDGVHITTPTALLGDVKVNDVSTDILFLPEHQVTLRILGNYQASLPQAKQFLLTTPLAKQIGITDLLSSTELTGQAQGRIALWLPIYSETTLTHIKLLGYAQLSEATWKDEQIDVSMLNSKLLFTEKRLDIPKLQGQWLGGPINGRLKQEDNTFRLLLAGSTPLNQPNIVQGEVSWKSDIRLLSKGQIEAKVIGQQDKLARLLPMPFTQSKGTKNDWKLSLTKKGQDIQLNWQDQDWRLISKLTEQDNNINIQQLNLSPLSQENKPTTKLDNDSIRLHIPHLNLSNWLNWYTLLPNQTSSSISLPQHGNLWIEQLSIDKQAYQNVMISWEKKENIPLNVSINAEGLKGSLRMNADNSSSLNLSRLRWKLPYQTAIEKLSEPLPVCAKPDDKSWSKLTIAIDELDLITERPEGTQLTPITQLHTELYQDGETRYLKDINFSYKTLHAQGAWMWHKAQDHSHLFLKTSATKAEHFAALFGLENSLDGGAIHADSFVDWQGGLDCFDLRNITAKVNLLAKEGSLAETSPGLARILGLLSFDAFTRRLKLGLADVTGTGLAYDRIKLDATISHGMLTVNEMNLSGPSVRMSLLGNTDLIGEIHQLKAQVTPLIGDSIPTLALISGASPITAIGVYLLQKIIPPLNGNILSFDYDITGSWQNPELMTPEEPEKNVNILSE